MICLKQNLIFRFCRNMPSEAEKEFWGSPKLIENLLLFLDTYSINCLAQVNTPSQISHASSYNPKYQIHNPKHQNHRTQIPSEPHPKPILAFLPFLNSNSITCLAQAHKPALDVILDKSVWRKLIKRVCNWKRTLKPSNQEKEFQQMRIQVTL